MKIFKQLLLPILILCSVTACSSNRELRFGAAGIGGNYYLFGETFAKQVSADTGLKFEVKETAGSAANLRLLDDNYVQICIAQSDLIDEALKSGEIDAMFVTIGTHTAVVEGLTEDLNVRFLPIEGDARSILLNSYDFYEERTIPAGTYTGQAEDVATIGVNSILLMNSLVPEDTAYTITKELFEHASDIQNEMPLTLELDLSGITIPFHPGAEKYFAEAGIDIPAADGR